MKYEFINACDVEPGMVTTSFFVVVSVQKVSNRIAINFMLPKGTMTLCSYTPATSIVVLFR